MKDKTKKNQIELKTIFTAILSCEAFQLFGLMTNNGGCETQILKRLAMARYATTKLTMIWRDITISIKLKLATSLVFPIATAKRVQ